MRKLLLIVACILSVTALLAQRTITGKVTDENGNPVVNASVTIKETGLGVSTDAAGNYSIPVDARGKTLVFSYVGKTPVEETIGNRNSFNTTLRPNTIAESEVVVVAYGTAKKETLTGSVGTIKSEDIAKRPIGNVTRAIEGAIPGVITTSGTGQPGAGTSIRVRGFGSINATSEPLLVLDGVPYIGGTSNINPDDVESITILKDASSTALYGSRAANGVLMITTKKGKKGRNNVSVKVSQGIVSRGLPEYERVNASEYYPLMWESYRNSLIYPATGTPVPTDIANQLATGLLPRNAAGLQVYNSRTYSDIRQLLGYNPFNVPNTAIVGVDGKLNPNAQLLYPDDLDWGKELQRNGSRKDYGINFSGGADKSDYFISFGYLNEKGFTNKTDLERYSARVNLNVQPLKWLKTGINMSGNFTTSNSASEGGGIVNPFNWTRNIGPIYPYYAHNMTTGALALDANGNKVYDLGNFQATAFGIANGIPNRPGTLAGRHAPAEQDLNERLFRRTVVSARSATDITFLKNFKFTNNVSFDFQSQHNGTYENTLVGDGAPGGRSQKQALTSTAFIASQILNYDKSFGSHKVEMLVGHESYNQYDNDVNGFKTVQSLSGNTELSNFTTITNTGSSVDRYTIESFLSRANYSYKNKYFVSGSLRRDGNSRFSSKSRWGTFWSVGGGWNMEKENFMAKARWIDNLKLRSSYGVVGVADGIGFYAYQGLYGFANNANEPGIVQSQTLFLNTDLTWEENKQFDVGIDFSLFKDRITGSVEYYNRQSVDLLFAVPQPLSSGALTNIKNTATMYNKGIEVQLGVDIIRTKNFTWNTNINLSTVSSKITKMPDAVPEFINGTKKLAVGVSQYHYWLRTFYGVDPTDGVVLYKALNTATTVGRRLIANKNGGLDTVTTLGNNALFEFHKGVIPDLYGSLTQSFSFKDFTLSALFTFQVGGRTYDANYQGLMASSNYGGAFHKDILKRWQQPGDITDVPRMDAGRAVDFEANSSRWLTDASYFNIRTVNLSYSLPKSLLSRAGISGGQFFISAENVAFISKRRGMNNQDAFTGVTGGGYPPARIITAGLNITL